MRAYLIFFGDGGTRAWWNLLNRCGYRHVCAAGFDPEADRWVFVDPHRQGMDVVVLPESEATAKLGAWGQAATCVLRVEVRRDRTSMPAVVSCVGAVKALVGSKSRALLLATLHRHLLHDGAEIIEVPCGQSIREQRSTSRPG